MRHIFGNLKKYWKSVLILAVLLIVQGFCEMSMPQYTQNIIDVGIQNKGIEHILPARITADEYDEAQIFMDGDQRKEWQASYVEGGENYTIRDLGKEEWKKLDKDLLTPVVMAYQLGHMSEEAFRDMVKKQAESAPVTAGQTDAMTGANVQANSTDAMAGANGQATGSDAMTGANGQADAADAMAAAESQIDSMSAEELAKAFHLDVHIFEAKDENGRKATYVDVRPAIRQMIESGQMTDDQISGMREEISSAISKTGEQTMKAMAIRYAADADQEAGVDVNSQQKHYLWISGGKMMLIALLMGLAAIAVSFFASRVGAGVGRDLRYQVFHNVIGYSSAEMEKFQTSSLITRATNDVQQVQMVTTMLLRMVLYAPVLAVWGVVKVYQSHAKMSWVIALGIAVIVNIGA